MYHVSQEIEQNPCDSSMPAPRQPDSAASHSAMQRCLVKLSSANGMHQRLAIATMPQQQHLQMHLQMLPRARGFCEMTQWGLKTSYECAAGQVLVWMRFFITTVWRFIGWRRRHNTMGIWQAYH